MNQMFKGNAYIENHEQNSYLCNLEVCIHMVNSLGRDYLENIFKI